MNIAHYDRNERGTDYAVGDVHGHYIDSGAWHYTERPYLILRLDTLEAV